MSTRYHDITGYVLAGGTSRRLGTDKRLVTYDGSTLLQRTQSAVEAFTGRPPYVVGDNLAGFDIGAQHILADARPHCGPIGGLVAALDHCPTPWCLLLAVDLPHLTARDLERLAAGRASGIDVVTLSRTGHPEPLAALYHTRRADYWRRCLEQNILSVIDVIRTLEWKPIVLGSRTSSLDGINTPEDLSRMANP